MSKSVGDTVSTEVGRAWNKTIFGSDDFPDINSEEAQNAPIKPKPNVLDTAVRKVRREDEDKESRKNNLIFESDRVQKKIPFVFSNCLKPH